MAFEYIYIANKENTEIISLFQKYDICCIEDKVIRIIGKYTFGVNLFDIHKDDIIYKLEVLDEKVFKMAEKEYSYGERVFKLNQIETIVFNKLINEGDERAAHIYKSFSSEIDSVYKDYKYIQSQVFDALPFNDEEYSIITKEIKPFNLEEFIMELEEGGEDFYKLTTYEDFTINPSKPEPEYINRVDEIFSIISNEATDKAIYPEDETKYVTNLDLGIIKGELEQAAKDNHIKITITTQELGINVGANAFIILKPVKDDGLKDLYKFVFDESNEFKIKIARTIRREETDYLY